MTVLLFLPERDGAPLAWLRLGEDGGVVARGAGTPELEGPDMTPVAVAPPGGVTLRWVDLPATLAPAQAAAAARLAAAGLAAEGADALHVALADAPAHGGQRLVAIARADAMAAWLARLAGEGLAPARLLPAPMLLAAPPPGETVAVARDGLLWVRGEAQAFAAEPDVAAAVLGEAPRLLDDAQFEAGLAGALADAAPDLLQGRFAPRTRWTPDWPRIRRMAALAGAIVALVAAADVARGWRASVAAEAARAQAAALARPLLPPGARLTDPVAQLAAASVGRDGGQGFAARTAALFAAVRESEGATLESLEHSADGRMRAALAARSVADLAAVESRLDGLGIDAALGPVRQDGGRQRAELRVAR